MNVVSIVANLQKECDYYKEQCKEYAAVVKQLTEGVKPGEVEYIHPFDVYDLLNTSPVDYVDVIKCREENVFELENGKKYKQSVCIPAKTKNIV